MAKLFTKLADMGIKQPLGPVRDFEAAIISYRAGAKPENRFKRSPQYPGWVPVAIEPFRHLIGDDDIKLAMRWRRLSVPRRAQILRLRSVACRLATEAVCARIDGYGLGGEGVAWIRLKDVWDDLRSQRPSSPARFDKVPSCAPMNVREAAAKMLPFPLMPQ